MIWYVHRENDVIVMAGQHEQPDYAEEELDDGVSVELQAFLNPPEHVFARKMAAGLTITSTGTPALNGTYAVDADAQRIIAGVAAGIAARNRLPGGGSTFIYGDVNGAPHEFTKNDFLNFADAIEDYAYALYAAQGSGDWPSDSVTIA